MSTLKLNQNEVMSIATERCLKSFTITSFITYSLSYYLHKTNKYYNKRFAISAKVGIPLMASLFVGSVAFELTMSDAQKNPENWENGKFIGKTIINKEKKTIPIHHLLMNRIHDRPFYFATVMGIPLLGRILYTRIQEPHLSISQALLQTRVVSYLFYF